ncbi:hypothetical protein RBSH_03595 [Rhodopirellula baltica SH28]|uniref:Uncharacterized protein n=1 Tax=Rhodopirellula baltica SH28 TaxID=993517 RepID=K5D393_RHOBT|nr:hypothetical protein [Rhodopirellula baltica]EKK01077.1 hypothetical protein RBSH_03595 [Rhodopirellula baltica SH28]
MQPLENKRTKIQSGIARARLLLKRDLAWLPGYPMRMTKIEGEPENPCPWQSDSMTSENDSTSWSIDGEHLRRAQMTVTKLRHRFPRALPRIVDDADDWLRRIDFLLGLLKGFVHHGQTFGSDDVLQSGVLPARWTNLAGRMKSTHPQLASLLDAVTFQTLSDQRNCDLESLVWIEQHAAELTLLSSVNREQPLQLPIRILTARENLPSELLNVLVRCLTDPLICTCRWKRPDARLRQLCETTLKAAKQVEVVLPEDSSEESLAHLVTTTFLEVCADRPKQQRDRFALLNQLLASELVDVVAETQAKIVAGEEELSKRLRRLQPRHGQGPRPEFSYRDLKRKVAATSEIDRVRIATITALGNCLQLQKTFSPTESRLWIDFLTGFPTDHVALSIRLISKWCHSWNYKANHRRNFIRVIKLVSALIRRRGIPQSMLKHWYHHVDEKRAYNEFVVDTADELADQPKLEIRTVRLLEKVAYDLQLDIGSELISSLVEFAQATDNDDMSCSLIAHLTEKPDTTYTAINLRLAYHFGDSVDVISDVLLSLDNHPDLTELATQLKPLSDDKDLKRMIARRLADNDVKVLLRIAATTAILHNLKQPIPKCERFDQAAGWVNRYPSEFHSALESLGQAAADAPRIAESVLGKAFPSPEKLNQQIDVLESKLTESAAKRNDNAQRDHPAEPFDTPQPNDEGRMRGRLTNLRRRRTQVPSVSLARREKLIEKLRKRTELELLQQYAATSRLHAAAAMQRRFSLKTFPDEWLSPPFDRVLREINGLDNPMQDLGIRLLFETSERTTRNFDEEPRNLVFRQRMEATGVRMEPWLSDQVRQSATTADGLPYQLAFTRDVIDFLLMGFHFDTCLSPDSFNFFSTVANAVDLNKRVVYAKTDTGKVIGRCLFALNDSGEVLTYYRYSHNPRDGFAEAVDQFAEQLASQMQTSIATGGKVSKLVAKDWYDDGPWQTNSNWLGDDGLLARLTKDGGDASLLPVLLEEVGRDFLKRRVTELAINTRVREKPQFLQSLLDEFENELSVRHKFTIGVNVDSIAISHRLLSQLRWSEIVGLVNRHQCNECDVFHGIAEYSRVFRVLSDFHPTLALRAIRASRPSFIKDDTSDPNRTRRSALAHVHRLLGREHLAAKLSAK